MRNKFTGSHNAANLWSNIYSRQVVADVGTVRSDSFTKAFYKFAAEQGTKDSILHATLPDAGIKVVNGRVAKTYTLATTNHATQETTANQPYLGGNIAPNGHYCLNNPNGGMGYMTHPTISFGASDSWSVTTILNWNGTDYSYQSYCGSDSNGYDIFLKFNASYEIGIYFGIEYFKFSFDTKKIIGKTSIITITANNGFAKLYVDGIFVEQITCNTSAVFTSVITGYIDARALNGTMYSHIIRSQALTPTQVASQDGTNGFFRKYIPEIESVVIGTQAWTSSNLEIATTCKGTPIANVTDNTIWSSSQTLYATTYNARILAGDTVEQATYAALKASAMWQYSENDVAIGSVYGKLYNSYAVDLIDMDINYYNSDNPNNHWGWHVPSLVELETLINTLGGTNVAGGKLKKEGYAYWNSPNTGADNSSGFTALGGGIVEYDGGSYTKYYFLMYGTNKCVLQLQHGDSIVNINSGYTGIFLKRGLSLRLIKD